MMKGAIDEVSKGIGTGWDSGCRPTNSIDPGPYFGTIILLTVPCLLQFSPVAMAVG